LGFVYYFSAFSILNVGLRNVFFPLNVVSVTAKRHYNYRGITAFTVTASSSIVVMRSSCSEHRINDYWWRWFYGATVRHRKAGGA